jgi:hypothetical protein
MMPLRTLMLGAVGLVTALTVIGCGADAGGTNDRLAVDGTGPIPQRRMTIVAETCSPDGYQLTGLDHPGLRRVTNELILVCPIVRLSGEVAPADPDARAALSRTVGLARAAGYKTRIAVTMGDDLVSFPIPYSTNRSEPVLRDPAWRAKVVANLKPFADMADGLEIDFLNLPSGSRQAVTELFVALDKAVRPAKQLGVMAPPSTMDPSDTLGGAAFNLTAIAPHVDRIRMMTLDYSCCGQGGGPSIDSGWAVDVARYGLSKANGVPVDIAFPLYGTDFSDLGERFIDYTDGRAMADVFGVTPQRAIGGELNFVWIDAAGHEHETWYPDAITASRVLGAWDPSVLPRDVGVVFYGLGAEDPALFSTLARGLP